MLFERVSVTYRYPTCKSVNGVEKKWARTNAFEKMIDSQKSDDEKRDS